MWYSSQTNSGAQAENRKAQKAVTETQKAAQGGFFTAARPKEMVPEIGVEPTTFALRIGAHELCHDLRLDGPEALTTREIRDLMALQGQKQHV